MKRTSVGTLILIAAAWAATPGYGEAPQAAESGAVIRTEEKREVLEHKFTLVFRILYQSPGAARIDASDRAQAKAQLALARERFSGARREIVSENLEAADGLLSEALRMFGLAAREVPNPAQEQDARRVRFTRMLDEIQAFQGSQFLSARRQSHGGKTIRNPGMEQARDLIREAQRLADTERFAEALGVLEKARDVIVSEAGALLASQTLVYDLNFASPEDEFEYESARYDSHADLIEIAVAKYRPEPEAVRDIGELVEKSRRVRSLARELAVHGDYPTGIKTLQDATRLLQRALERAGLALPK